MIDPIGNCGDSMRQPQSCWTRQHKASCKKEKDLKPVTNGNAALRALLAENATPKGKGNGRGKKKLMSPASHTGDTPAWSPSSQSLGRVWWSKRCLVPWRLTIHNMYNVLLHIIIVLIYHLSFYISKISKQTTAGITTTNREKMRFICVHTHRTRVSLTPINSRLKRLP